MSKLAYFSKNIKALMCLLLRRLFRRDHSKRNPCDEFEICGDDNAEYWP